MKKDFFKYFVILIAVVGISMITFAFDEDSEVSIGVKRGSKIDNSATLISSQISFLLYDKESKSFKELNDSSSVKSGNQFLINVKNSTVSYLYILNVDASNKLYSLFPSKEISQSNPLWGNKPLSLPISTNKETAMYEFDDNRGKETYYVFVSKTKLEDIEKIVKDIPSDGINIENNSAIVRKIENLHKEGIKNVQSGPGASRIVWFKKFYSKKLIFNHE
ncbi:MAG: DUF4384 domain-containing protein [Spirochaetota bacterium]|nr:DUF4384 domain-containing protein [Spirochaetota bacterium]